MNSGSWSLEPISQDNLLVFVALGLVAILAVLTVIGMIVGARNKRRRVTAEHEEQARMDALRSDGVEASNGDDAAPVAPPEPAPEPSPALTPAPVAPAPPPPGDRPAPGMAAAPVPRGDEPVPAIAPHDPSPAAVVLTTTDAVSVTRLKGLGPKIAARLADLGITDVDQLAGLSDAEAADLDAQLAPFQGRMGRDRWREQARLLAAGDRAGFEREFGKLG